ncbi:MAG: hypothetical protein ACE5JL_13550 [Dehalococcoidia bacterium]
MPERDNQGKECWEAMPRLDDVRVLVKAGEKALDKARQYCAQRPNALASS